LLPGESGYFTCKQNMKLFATKFKSVGLHEKHVIIQAFKRHKDGEYEYVNCF